MTDKIEILDLFSAAAGGWSLGMHRAGFRTIAACEVIDWRRALYSENNPGVLVYDDVRNLTAERLVRDLGRLPSVIVGSPPCQDISSANTKGKGVEGERSGLYFEAIRLVGEIRPRWFAFENSANLRTRGADAVLAALEGLGYACWPFVVRAGDIGANHERPRSWLIGCDVAQVTDADGFGRDEGWSWRRGGLDVSVSQDPRHASSIGRQSRPGDSESRYGEIYGSGDNARNGQTGNVANANSDPLWLTELSGRSQPQAPVAGDDAVDPTRLGHEGGRPRRHGPNGDGTASVAEGNGEPVHADQTGQADGPLVTSLRQAQEPDDGRGARRGTDGTRAGQVGIREAGRLDALRSRADWSLDDLADHLRLDAGLSSWVADTRIAVGGPRGTSAASLIVEAFGDAVLPQIPEAIGRAMIRTEKALAAIYGRAAA